MTGNRHVSSYCVYVLSDGRRLRCPPAFARAAQTVISLERATACSRLSPIAIPASWRRVFVQIGKVRACLTSRGLRVTGGPSLGTPRNGPDTPIGELIVIKGNAPTFIGFYESRRAAEQDQPRAIENMKRLEDSLHDEVP